MISPTRLSHLDRSNSAFVPTHERDEGPQGSGHLAAAQVVEEESRYPGRPIFQQRDELTFRYCRSDQHLGEVADTDPSDRGLKDEIGVVDDK